MPTWRGNCRKSNSIETYAGTPAPFNFNGLVRHYYIREAPELGELHLNLAPRSARDRSSHDIALDLRGRLDKVKLPKGTVARVVEVPPGPPVLATLLAEVYGPDSKTRRAVAAEVKKIFASVPYIVDIDDSIGESRPRLRISIDQDRLEFFGVEQSDVYDTIQALLGGTTVGYSHRGEGPQSDRDHRPAAETQPVLERASRLDAGAGQQRPRQQDRGRAWRRRPRDRGGGLAGDLPPRRPLHRHGDGGARRRLRGPDLRHARRRQDRSRTTIGVRSGRRPSGSTASPRMKSKPVVLWDGEWEITYVTFRDMGAAFMVAIIGIYILVVAQFGSFKLPLVILTPIPLTLIGIVLGHWLFSAPFTATSMIGFIALAGIIVRNSILLVDFIRHGAGHGKTLREVLLEAGAVRFKPILLTALAAMIGAATILVDPIFQGLAISLLFGLASSTLLTVLVIPAIYVVLRDADRVQS